MADDVAKDGALPGRAVPKILVHSRKLTWTLKRSLLKRIVIDKGPPVEVPCELSGVHC